MDIEEAFRTLKLDSRASKQEVELAYESLSKTGVNIGVYRSAFETLMIKVFNECEEVNEEEVYSNIIINMPEEVIGSICDLDLNDMEDRAMITWATQKVNLPLLFCGINKLRSLFGFIKKKDLIDVINTSACLNDLEYIELTFELSYDSYKEQWKIDNLRKFVKGIEKIYEKELIKKFKCSNTEFGIMCRCIIEAEVGESVINMVKVKAKHCECSLNMNVCR